MSSIFDSVDDKSSRRKARLLEMGPTRHMFEPDLVVLPAGSTGGPAGKLDGGPGGTAPQVRIVIDSVWAVCVACILFPVGSFVSRAVAAPSVSPDMANIPYDCSLFYLGLFVGLPGASVYVFCCTLLFNPRAKTGIFLCMFSIFVFICAVERTCMTNPDPDSSTNFYMVSTSVLAGVGAQAMFVLMPGASMLEERRHAYLLLLALATVMVVLSVIAVALAGTVFDENYSKASCYITTIPLAIGVALYVLSTYSVMSPVRAMCQKM
jgi:hypothetical protein